MPLGLVNFVFSGGVALFNRRPKVGFGKCCFHPDPRTAQSIYASTLSDAQTPALTQGLTTKPLMGEWLLR